MKLSRDDPSAPASTDLLRALEPRMLRIARISAIACVALLLVLAHRSGIYGELADPIDRDRTRRR